MLRFEMFILGAAFILLFVIFAVPQLSAELSKADEREVNDYQLTEKKLEQFGKATKSLVALAQKNVKVWPKPSEIADAEAGTLTKLAERFDKIPGVKKAVEDAGMTSREYWVFHLATVYGSTGHIIMKSGGKLPNGFSRTNTEFYGKQEAAFIAVEKDLKLLQELSQQIPEIRL